MNLSLDSAVSWMKNDVFASKDDLVENARVATEAADRMAEAARGAAELPNVAESVPATDKAQALFDALYLVACADGATSEAERKKITDGLCLLVGEGISSDRVDDGLEMSRVAFEEKGLEGLAKEIASVLVDEVDRKCAVIVASAVAWLDGGVGAKEGVTLQTLAKAFGIATSDLHHLMAEGAKRKA